MNKKQQSRIEFNLHANGVAPGMVAEFNRVARAAWKAGCTVRQATMIAKLAYVAKEGFHWHIPGYACGLQIETQLNGSK